MSSIIADLGGRDTDLRQQNVSDPPVTDNVLVKKLLDIWLADPDSPLARYLNNVKQLPEYEPIPAQVKEPELPDAAPAENVQFKDSQSFVMLETTAPCLPYSIDASANEVGTDHMLHLKVSSFKISYYIHCECIFCFQWLIITCMHFWFVA